MENDLLCLIGEAVLLEVHGIKDVSYPMDEENACIVVTDENKRAEGMSHVFLPSRFANVAFLTTSVKGCGAHGSV